MMTIKITQIKNATAGNGRSSLSPLPSLSYLKIESSGVGVLPLSLFLSLSVYYTCDVFASLSQFLQQHHMTLLLTKLVKGM